MEKDPADPDRAETEELIKVCGSVDVLSQHDPIRTAVVQRATQSRHHRGPDSQRHWIVAVGRVALGHARLSILDLTTEDQPAASEDRRTRIVVDGELRGYESIRNELARSGHHLRTQSDSEISLNLYEDLGAHCPQPLAQGWGNS